MEKQTAADYVSKTDAAVQNGAVAKADKTIGENVTNLDGALAKETAARIGADAAQDKVIQQVNQNVAKGFNDLNQNIGKITDQLNKNDLVEAQARDAADQKLQGNIDAETTARQTDVANLRKNITDSLIAQGKINETLTTTATNLENHLSDTDGRVDKANAEIHTNAGNIAQSQKDIADIQDTLKNANAFASADATKAANEAAEKANTVANGLKDRVDLISNNQNVTSESDLIKKDQSVGQNLTNVDTALHKEIAARIGADAAQDKVIKGVNDSLVSSVNTINKNIGTITDQLNKNDLAEAQARDAADQKLQGNIDAETTARKDADTKLDTRITNVKEYLQNETEKNYVSKGMYNRETSVADGAFVKEGQTVGQNLNAVDKGLNDEIAARIGADAAQDKVIQQVNQNAANGIGTLKKVTDQLNQNDLAEAQTRAAADKTLQDNIDAEATARQADISRLDNKIHDVSKEVDTVGALSMAMSGLHPLSYDEGDARFQLSAAVGTYDGTEALALGGFYHFNRDSMLSVGVATDLGADEHRMGANVGYTRRIGQGGHVSRPSEGTVSDIMKDIKNLEQKQAKLEQENEQLKQQLAALKK